MEFSQVWQLHQQGISRVVKSYEANPHEQQELMQEIGLAIWRALPSCKDVDKVKPFIYRIAHNQAVDHVTRQVKKPTTTSVDIDLFIADERKATTSVQQQKLLVAMRELPINQKQVISLLFEGFSYQQIAEIAGLSQSNVGALINRGKQKLQASINEK